VVLLSKQLLIDGLAQIIPNGFNTIANVYKVSFTAGSYDDEQVVTINGSFLSSGLLFPIRGKQGSQEAMLMEQGKLLTQDKVIYLNSTTNFNGSAYLFNIGGSIYSVVPDGITNWQITGSTIYNKVYLRYQKGGSLF